MISIDEMPREGMTDADLINKWVNYVCENRGGGDIVLGANTYRIDKPIILRTGVRIRGEGVWATRLMATPELNGPVFMSENAEALQKADAWLFEEGVPVRFRVSDLMIDGSDGVAGTAFGAGCGIYLYGKGFELLDIQISHMKSHGLVSVGTARGGQKSWSDEPEALFDLRISRCGGDGFLMRGPHDSIIRQAIIALCKGRGLAVETNGIYNGACDIEFCHAYATDRTAIDLAAKVKAGFLQGDTGRGCGVRVSGSNKTYIDRIESFKTRGTTDQFALDIDAPFTQIGLARVRADWGTSGVRIAGPGCQISQLDIDGLRNTGGPLADTENNATGLLIEKNQTQINSFQVRHFSKGSGVVIKPGLRGLMMAGITSVCEEHLHATGLKGSDLRMKMFLRKHERYIAEPGPRDNFELTTFPPNAGK